MKRIAIFASALLLALQAEDFSNQALVEIVESYRKSEFKEIENKLQTLLLNKDYWLSALKNQDVRYGYYENIENIFVSDKSIPNLTLYRYKNGILENLGTSEALVGSGKGNKNVSGDLTTPIGVYDLKNKLTKLDGYYGPMAFVTSYPNAYDLSLKKTGYGIWIHGMPLNGNRDELNTKGCIAIENADIIEFDKKINFNNTILITYEGEFIPPSKEEIANILSQIFLWKETWEKGDFDNYIAFYSPNFKKSNRMGYKSFKQYKQRVFAKNESKKIQLSKINIVPYPNMEGKKLFRVTFNQDYMAFDKNKKVVYKSNGKKEIYLTLENDGNIAIVLEE